MYASIRSSGWIVAADELCAVKPGWQAGRRQPSAIWCRVLSSTDLFRPPYGRQPQGTVPFSQRNQQEETDRETESSTRPDPAALALAIALAMPLDARRRSRTSSSSGATTSAGTTSAPTTSASWATRRPTSTVSPSEGALFTDWYGQQSCTAGSAAFITGQSPIRTGLLKVGLTGCQGGHVRSRTRPSPPCSRITAT